MSFYGFEYFCGANVTIHVAGLPVLEAAGLQYEMTDSKMPLYGYSSRHFDAVAQGQVIVHGTLLINFVHQDYLFRAINRATGGGPAPQPPAFRSTKWGDAVDPKVDFEALKGDYSRAAAHIEAQKQRIWEVGDNTAGSTSELIRSARNPSDILDGIDIKAVFGQQGDGMPNGKTSVLLSNLHFTGRSNVIRIDEDVIVEAYPFFARDIYSLRNVYSMFRTPPDAFAPASQAKNQTGIVIGGDEADSEEFTIK